MDSPCGMDALLYGYLCLAAIGLVQSGLMLVHAWEHRRYYRRRLSKKPGPEAGMSVALIAPCKGCDADLYTNLLALFWQRYSRYQICFVVESEDDPAVRVIRELAREHPRVPCRMVVAGTARDCGQKVHNLMCATRAVLECRELVEAPPRPPLTKGGRTKIDDTLSSRPDVLAFVDADACPHVEWLARLVDRLSSRKNTIATGYRWYVPQTGAFVNRLLSAINNTIISLTGPHGFNLAWGGAWAIRADRFEELGLPGAWAGSLSDDLVVSRLVHAARRRVVFEPHCLVKSSADFDSRRLREFLRRQFLVAKVYAPVWWHFGLWAGLATNVCLWGTLGCLCAFAAFGGPWALPLAGGLAYYAAGAWRAHLSARAVRPYVAVPDEEYGSVARLSVWGWPLVSLAGWIAVASATFGRTIIWRGIKYRMNSPQSTTVGDRSAALTRENHAHARAKTRAA